MEADPRLATDAGKPVLLITGARGGSRDRARPRVRARVHGCGPRSADVSAIASAEVARAERYFNVVLGVALLVVPFAYEAEQLQTVASIACGLALNALSLPRGRINSRYGGWERFSV